MKVVTPAGCSGVKTFPVVASYVAGTAGRFRAVAPMCFTPLLSIVKLMANLKAWPLSRAATRLPTWSSRTVANDHQSRNLSRYIENVYDFTLGLHPGGMEVVSSSNPIREKSAAVVESDIFATIAASKGQYTYARVIHLQLEVALQWREGNTLMLTAIHLRSSVLVTEVWCLSSRPSSGVVLLVG